MTEVPMPVLLVVADNDSISQKRVAEFFALLGGGVKEPGWRYQAIATISGVVLRWPG